MVDFTGGKYLDQNGLVSEWRSSHKNSFLVAFFFTYAHSNPETKTVVRCAKSRVYSKKAVWTFIDHQGATETKMTSHITPPNDQQPMVAHFGEAMNIQNTPILQLDVRDSNGGGVARCFSCFDEGCVWCQTTRQHQGLTTGNMSTKYDSAGCSLFFFPSKARWCYQLWKKAHKAHLVRRFTLIYPWKTLTFSDVPLSSKTSASESLDSWPFGDSSEHHHISPFFMGAAPRKSSSA